MPLAALRCSTRGGSDVSDAGAATATLLLVLVVVGSAWVSESPAVAVYALSFWHYLLYWWAYRHGQVTARRLRWDASVMKSLALGAFGYAWATVPSTWPAVVTMATGFALNGSAAWRLGADRTYYGWELGELSYRQVAHFPYSVVPHPMLLGNVVAFAGALAAPAFRAAWWPLSVLHVAMNIGLLLMETRVSPSAAGGSRGPWRSSGRHRDGVVRHAVAAGGGAAIGAVVAHITGGTDGAVRLWPGAAVGAAAFLQLSVVSASYLPSAADAPVAPRGVRKEVSR